jgi:hypothetical protein
MNVPSTGELSLTPPADGDIQLTLMAPEGCQVVSPNPRTVALNTGDQTRVPFNVRCG